MKHLLPLSLLFSILLVSLFYSHRQYPSKKAGESPSEAGAAFRQWGAARLFPDGQFHTEKYSEAFSAMRLASTLRGERSPSWQDLGPKNIGGRTLCLAINPVDTNILWLGSASGGIWKSTTAGRGAAAWQRVETGFPVLGVSSIALSPADPNVIYAGTGEVYNVENSQPNVAIRTTRGTYGIGILKSTDGGNTWFKSLDWGYGQLRGVQDIKINPLRAATVFAATSEGLLRSWDAGASWHTVQAQKMAVDIEIDPVDTNRIYVTFGSLNDYATSGIYRSTNGGSTFNKLTNGLPEGYTGKALLGLAPSDPNTIYASIGDSTTQNGLYQSIDGGEVWDLINSDDVCTYQGWYSHDVAVSPADPNTIIWVGIDAYKSTDGGIFAEHKTYWHLWTFGFVPAGEPEGPPNYVHADIHRAYYAPGDPEKVYLVTDGGLFVSYDGGETYEGRNGGYQSQQFYANLGNSGSNADICIGGMQDNATAIYYGDPSWIRVIGGDGECAAINPLDDQIMYGSSQYLNLRKSIDGGSSFYGIGDEIHQVIEEAAFNGPFELAPSNPFTMYAGAESLWRSDDAGESWYNISSGPIADGNVVLNIAINPSDPDELFCSTAPTRTNQARVYRFSANTGTAVEMQGLPNRYCMDIAYHPVNHNIVFAVFNGFNTQHIFRSEDNGNTWSAIDNGIPDVPANTILIDPLFPDNIYVGNDLGVWFSDNGGLFWSLYSAEAPQAMLAMHLSISADRKLRVATYGLGVWQTELSESSNTSEKDTPFVIQSIRPNPASDKASVYFNLNQAENISIEILDIQGNRIWLSPMEKLGAGQYERPLPITGLPTGTYGVVLQTRRGKTGSLLMINGR